MTKKILLIVFVLFIVITTIFTYNFYKTVKEPLNSNSFVAIPQNASLVLLCKSFKDLMCRLNSSNIIWEELIKNTEISNIFNAELNLLDSLTNDEILTQLIANQSFLCSLHQLSANNYGAIYYFTLSKRIDIDYLINHLRTVTKTNPEERNYDNQTIYNFPYDNNKNISLIHDKGIVAISLNSILIEDVVHQINSKTTLMDNESFKKVVNTAGESDFGNLFININNTNKIANSFLEKTAKLYAKNIGLFGSWIALDMSIKSNALMLNGFTLATDSSNYFLTLFKDQDPQEQELINILPKNTAFVYYQSYSNVKTYFRKKYELLKRNNQSHSYNELLEFYTTQIHMDILEEWQRFLGNELASVILEPKNDLNYENEKFLVMRITDQEKALKFTQEISLKINLEHYPFTTFNEYQIGRIDFNNFFSVFLGAPFFDLNNPYFTFVDEYLVFGSSEVSIQDFISHYINQKTLKYDANYQSYKENLASTSNIFIYNNLARSVKLYPNFLEENYHKTTEEKAELLRKFEAFSVQISSQKNNLYYTNLYLKYNPVYKQDTRSVWETELEGTILGHPEIVVNHINNTKEIFVQDHLNKIYLISNTGKIIWTKQLSENIIGKVQQVDALKNNKLQLLFNTSSKIYLIDRNGNNVANFPITLPTKASNAITVLDYENNKNYRLLIGCEDNKVYNYDMNGNLVVGWEYKPENSPATKTISHFVSDKKDYIVVALQNGLVKVIERNGKDRFKLKNRLPITNNTAILKANNDLTKTYIVTIDSVGNIVKLFFKDIIETKDFKDQTGQTFFELFDINSDNFDDFVFVNNNILKVQDAEKKELLKLELKEKIIGAPLFFKMPDKSIKIGLVTDNNIYLVDKGGNILNNFPLKGSTNFSVSNLSNDKNLNLVVGDKKLIYMYNLE